MQLAMKRVDRLIARSVIAAIVLTWILLVAVDAMGALTREADEIGQGNYSLTTAVGWLLLTIPRRAYEWFGTAALIGGLMGLGALAPTGEITAMRAGGMSKLRICFSVLIGIGALTVLVFALGETVAPWGEQRAQALQASAQSRDVINRGRTGIWAREGEVLINARRGRSVVGGVELFEVRLYEFTPAGQLTRLSQAARAEHGKQGWVLHDVIAQNFAADSVGTEKLALLRWKSSLDPRLLETSVLRPEYLSLADLDGNITYLRRNQLDASAFESAYWRRIFYPLSTLVLAFAALPFAFGALRSGGFAKRVFLGMVLALTWFFVQRALIDVSQVYGVDFRVANVLPALIVAFFAGMYFRRAS